MKSAFFLSFVLFCVVFFPSEGTCSKCIHETTSGQCCVFPFRYKNVFYDRCIKVDYNGAGGKSWCAITHNYDTDKRWGTCKETKKTYTFLLTRDVSLGTLGKIESAQSGCQTSFECTGKENSIAVDRFKGTLTLKKNPCYLGWQYWNGIREFATNIKVVESVCRNPTTYYVKVKLFVFPYNFGDTFLKAYSKDELTSMVNENQESGSTSMASALHRIMRMVSKDKNLKAFEEMMAAVKVEAALEDAKHKIVRKHVTRLNLDEQIVFRWSLNSLFSRAALKKLADNSDCETKKVPTCSTGAKYRTIDGTCNNINNPLFGSAPNPLTRFVPAIYYDNEGLSDPIGFPGQNNVPDIPATFEVVETFIAEQDKAGLSTIFSHLLMQFGQFLDHDLDLSPETENSNGCMRMTMCDGSKQDFAFPCYTILPLEPNFNCINFARSAAECRIQNCRITRREQLNVNTAFIDGSQIYGSTDMLANKLRDSGNKGLLKARDGVNGKVLPCDDRPLMPPNDLCQDFGGCFLAGDGRSSEQMVLACTHTLFLREHNRIARALGKLNPHWDDEKIYQETRKIVGAVLQKITYEDFLPIIIGKTLPKYTGYDSTINPGILNSFATAAFRFGHSLIRPTFDRLDKGFNPTGDPLQLRELFFNNTFIRKFGIDEMLLGLLGNESQIVDRKLAVGILNNLFERKQSPGLNLAALNIQRSRDHGLPGYNLFRCQCGLKNAKSFSDTSNEIRSFQNRKLLSQLYNDDPNLADLWVAGLAESPVKGGIVGATFGCIIREQMRRVRDGDRFFYMKKGVFSDQQLKEIKKATLSKIMCDNLNNIVSVQTNAFLAGSQKYRRVECTQIPGIDLNAWEETNNCVKKTTKGQCCVFPFRYKYKLYSKCTTVDYGNTLWCATTSNYDKDRKWGTCM